MLSRFRPRLTYANVMSTLALFIALGGSSYAAVSLNGKDIKHRSVTGTKIKRNTLTNLEIRESRLGTVPRAKRANLAHGLTERGAEALLHCPEGTVHAVDTCIEVEPRGDASYTGALLACSDTTTTHVQRRLPTHGELTIAFTQRGTVHFRGPELTGDVYPSAARPGGLDVLVLTSDAGSVGVTSDEFSSVRKFRCAVDPRPRGRGQ